MSTVKKSAVEPPAKESTTKPIEVTSVIARICVAVLVITLIGFFFAWLASVRDWHDSQYDVVGGDRLLWSDQLISANMVGIMSTLYLSVQTAAMWWFSRGLSRANRTKVLVVGVILTVLMAIYLNNFGMNQLMTQTTVPGQIQGAL